MFKSRKKCVSCPSLPPKEALMKGITNGASCSTPVVVFPFTFNGSFGL